MTDACSIVVAVASAVKLIAEVVATFSQTVNNKYHHDSLSSYSRISYSLKTNQQRLVVLNEAWGTARPRDRRSFIDAAIKDHDAAVKIKEGLGELQTIGGDMRYYATIQPSHSQKRSSICNCFHWLNRKPVGFDSRISKLEDSVNKFSEVVDELWSYFRAASEQRDPQSLYRQRIAGRSDMARAEQVRASMVAMYEVCSMMQNVAGSVMTGMDMNLVKPDIESITTIRPFDHHSHSLMYHLFLRSAQAPEKWKEIRLQSIETPGKKSRCEPIFRASNIADLDIGFHSEQDAIAEQDVELVATKNALSVEFSDMAKNGARGRFAYTTQIGLEKALYYTVDKPMTQIIPTPRITFLSDLFESSGKIDLLSPDNPMRHSRSRTDRLSMRERIDLAYTVAQFGYFTLGTQWAAYLRSVNIQRLSSTTDDTIHYVLDVSSPAERRAIVVDPSRLDENLHLHQIGTLLVEIGLQQFASSVGAKGDGTWPERVRGLSSVEQAMGAKYCEAVAFCMQTRQSPALSRRPEKYDYATNEVWREYLSNVLAEYEERVLGRLREMRNVKINSY